MQHPVGQKQVQWSQDEMVALTDIFKNMVHEEIEHKRQSTNVD